MLKLLFRSTPLYPLPWGKRNNKHLFPCITHPAVNIWIQKISPWVTVLVTVEATKADCMPRQQKLVVWNAESSAFYSLKYVYF